MEGVVVIEACLAVISPVTWGRYQVLGTAGAVISAVGVTPDGGGGRLDDPRPCPTLPRPLDGALLV